MFKNWDIKRVLLTLVAVLFMGASLSVLRLVNHGMDSFTHMNVSIAQAFGFSLGNWQLVLNVLLFIPVILWGRKQIGIGTLFNMVLVGYTVDFCSWVWRVSGAESLIAVTALHIIATAVALVVFILAAAVYMSTDLGTAPFDALPIMLSEKLRLPFKLVRFLWDATAVGIGFAFSRSVGVVTVLMVLFLGPTVAFVRRKMLMRR